MTPAIGAPPGVCGRRDVCWQMDITVNAGAIERVALVESQVFVTAAALLRAPGSRISQPERSFSQFSGFLERL